MPRFECGQQLFGLVAKGGSPDGQWTVFVQREVFFPDAEGEVDQFQFVPLQPDLVGIAVAGLAFALRRQAEVVSLQIDVHEPQAMHVVQRDQ